MTQLSSRPGTCKNCHDCDDENNNGAAHGLVPFTDVGASVNCETSEDFHEDLCHLSPSIADSSTPLVSPLSLPSVSGKHHYPGFPKSSLHGGVETLPLEVPVITLLSVSKQTKLSWRGAGLCNKIPKMDIGWPTDVRHITHVTFDRFNGFLGLPVEFELEVPQRVPSASASVFGVSTDSMQCSYDQRGNSVPTILLLLQERLYDQGGLKAEGIFRINAESGEEENLRDQLNKGIIPDNIDVHCLAGLIKAWFRELPKGVLDSLSLDRVSKCNAEEQCISLVSALPQTESALLNWTINLMADVVQHEQFNKMNARNIAMVFAPNMIKKSDPLTALVHVVEIMNLLKSLVLMTIKGREEAALKAILEPSCKESKHEIIHRQESVQSHGTALVTESYCKNDYVFSARDIQSESFVDSRPLCGLKDIFSKHCRTVDVTEEGDTCFDDQIPLSNSPAKLDSADGDGQNMSWQSANNYNDMYISGLLLSDLKESVHANERQKARRGHLGNPFAGTSGIVSMQCRSLH